MNKLIPLKVGVKGYFRLVAHRLDGSSRVLVEWFDNLVLNGGLNRMGTGGIFDYCQVGSGSTAPVVTDTALVSKVAHTSDTQSTVSGNAPSAPYYAFIRKTYRFAMGTAAGNLSEVGVGWASTGSLFSRALIKDGNGDPTTITVLSDEVLDVTYELRNYAPSSDSSYSAVIGGVTYNLTQRAAYVTSSTYWNVSNQAVSNYYPSGNNYALGAFNDGIGAVTASPSGAQGTSSTTTADAYSNNSLQRDFTSVFDLNYANLSGGIKSFLMCTTIGAFQAESDVAIPKTSSKILTVNWRVSWARH